MEGVVKRKKTTNIEFERAMEEWKNCNYKEALGYLRLATENDTTGEAYKILGDCYLNGGLTLLDNRKMAIECYKKSAELGHTHGTFTYGRLTRDKSLMKSTFDKGDCFVKGLCYENGAVDIDKPQRRKAFEWFTKAAANEDSAHAKYRIGIYYQFGICVDENHEIARTWYAKAAQHELAHPQYHAAILFCASPDNQNDARIWRWLKKSAIQGFEYAIDALDIRKHVFAPLEEQYVRNKEAVVLLLAIKKLRSCILDILPSGIIKMVAKQLWMHRFDVIAVNNDNNKRDLLFFYFFFSFFF